MADEPQWLLDARAKEGQLIEPHVVTSADKRISFSVPVALSGSLKQDKGSYEALFTLGPQAAADCEILNSDVDVAALLRETGRTTFSDVIQKAQGKIEQRAVERIDAGVAGATPYLSVVWLYRVNDGKVAKLGGLRQYAATKSGHAIYCALNDLGYAKTFATVVRALIESLKTKDDSEVPYYSEVSVATVRDMRIGYTEITMRRDKDGDTKCVDTTVILTTTGADALQSRDSVHVEWVKPDGTLINGSRITSSNAEIDMDLALKQGDGGSWQVEGKFKGKDVKETIAAGEPGTWLSQTHLLRTLLAKEQPIGAGGVRKRVAGSRSRALDRHDPEGSGGGGCKHLQRARNHRQFVDGPRCGSRHRPGHPRRHTNRRGRDEIRPHLRARVSVGRDTSRMSAQRCSRRFVAARRLVRHGTVRIAEPVRHSNGFVAVRNGR